MRINIHCTKYVTRFVFLLFNDFISVHQRLYIDYIYHPLKCAILELLMLCDMLACMFLYLCTCILLDYILHVVDCITTKSASYGCTIIRGSLMWHTT